MTLAPFKEAWIKDVKKGDKVAMSGMVVSREGDSVVLDDGTGQVVVSLASALPSDYVKVYGTMIDERHLQGEFAQDLSAIDRFLYNKVKKLLV